MKNFQNLLLNLIKKITSLTLKLSDCRVKCSQALTSSQEIKSRQSVVDSSIEKAVRSLKSLKSLKQKVMKI